MQVFVTGWDGLLGTALVPALRRHHEVEGIGIRDGDIADADYVVPRVREARPDLVVHLAAMTAVDRCEAEPEEAFRVNEQGSRVVARAAHEAGAAVLGLSTDYVFDGALARPYRETDGVRPLNVYGKSKAAGETALRTYGSEWLVVRSAWLYGPGGANFVDTILGLLQERERIPVVDDQVGSPTFTADLAGALAALLPNRPRGIYHVANAGPASWYDLAREAARLTGADPGRIVRARTADVGRPAPRPSYSVLDCTRAEHEIGRPLRGWKEALREFIGGPAAAKKEKGA